MCERNFIFPKKFPTQKENPLLKGFSHLFSHKDSCLDSFTGILQDVLVWFYCIFLCDQYNGRAAESKVAFFFPAKYIRLTWTVLDLSYHKRPYLHHQYCTEILGFQK